MLKDIESSIQYKRRRQMNNKGQMFMVKLMLIVMSIMILTAFIPVLRTTMDTARHQDALNCKSNVNVCSTSTEIPCYNSSKSAETTSCLALDIYLPYIILAVIMGGVMFLLAGDMMGMNQQPQQGGY